MCPYIYDRAKIKLYCWGLNEAIHSCVWLHVIWCAIALCLSWHEIKYLQHVLAYSMITNIIVFLYFACGWVCALTFTRWFCALWSFSSPTFNLIAYYCCTHRLRPVACCSWLLLHWIHQCNGFIIICVCQARWWFLKHPRALKCSGSSTCSSSTVMLCIPRLTLNTV